MVALYHTNRTIFKLTGSDTLSFLQGIMTNDSETLAEKEILYTVMLTSTGRFHFEYFLYQGDTKGAVYLDTPTIFAGDLLKRLRLFKLRSDVTIEDISDHAHVVTYHDIPPPSDSFAFQDPRHLNLGYRGLIFGDRPKEGKGTYKEDESYYTQLCLKNCIPRAGFELLPEKTIPLEANLEELNALCFTKGCYLGQELTARTKHQGMVRKKLYPVFIEGDVSHEMIQGGLTIYDGDRKIGVLLSHEKGIGIAKIRLEDVNSDDKETPKTWQGIVKGAKIECCKITHSPSKEPPK